MEEVGFCVKRVFLVAFFPSDIIYVGMGREKMSQSKFPVFAVVALWKNAATNITQSPPKVTPKKINAATSSIVLREKWIGFPSI